MVGSGPQQLESMGSHRVGHPREGHEGSVHTTHTGKSHSRGDSHVSHEERTKSMQKEIDHLKRKLHRKQRRRSPSTSNLSSDSEKYANYRCKSRTPQSETYSYEEDYRRECKNRESALRGLGSDAMSKALDRISMSPFSSRIENATLPRRFTQPTFTMYTGRTDPIEHVSHFNQRMAVHSKNEVLMCKVFPSSLGPVAMRWFDGLGAGSVGSFKELTQAFGSRFITCN